MELSLPFNRKTIARRNITTEREMFALLYEQYALKVFNSIYRIVNERALAEDILHDAFCRAFEERGNLREAEKFEGWVKRIAINLSISHLRKNKGIFKTDEVAEQADNPYDPEEEKSLLRKVADIKAAIAALPTGYRTIIALHLFEDIPQEEIARLLNISHSTVRTQYHRAKKKILTLLKERYDETR